MSDEQTKEETQAPQTVAVEEKLTIEEAEQIQKVMFETDEEVKLRDGKTYKLMPFGLSDALMFMKKLKSLNTEVIVLNLIDDANGDNAAEELFEVLLMAFKYNPLYKHVTREYLGTYVDLVLAKTIIEILLGLNNLLDTKK